MAWTKRELFSFARKCEYFNLRLESSVGGSGFEQVLCIARYDGPLDSRQRIPGIKYSDDILHGNSFPARTLRKAFDYAQQRANELGKEVRIVMEACVKEEHSEPYGEDYEGLFRVASIKPSRIGRGIQTLSRMPVLPCSSCEKAATQQFVARHEGGSSVIEYGCDDHIDGIHSHWA